MPAGRSSPSLFIAIAYLSQQAAYAFLDDAKHIGNCARTSSSDSRATIGSSAAYTSNQFDKSSAQGSTADKFYTYRCVRPNRRAIALSPCPEAGTIFGEV